MEAWSVTMRLEEPYAVAYETFATATNVFLALTTDTGLVGYGCAGPDEHVTGETPDAVLKTLGETVEPLLRGADPLFLARLLEQVRKAAAHLPSLVAAVDMALFDLLGKAAGLPVWRLLGGYRDRIATSVTVGILPERETLDQARRWVKLGFRMLKIKGGWNVEEDIARVIRVREAVGDDVALCFDANQGYTVPQALRFLERTAAARLQFLEQPTPQSEPNQLREVSRQAAVGVMADESLLTLDDAFRLACGNYCRMFNVKLMKVGGIAQARKIAALAEAAGIGVMTGCMDESALGIAAGLHFSLAEPGVPWADLDGHLGLIGDPAANSLPLRDGVLFASDSPGLGIELNR